MAADGEGHSRGRETPATADKQTTSPSNADTPVALIVALHGRILLSGLKEYTVVDGIDTVAQRRERARRAERTRV